MKACTKTYNLTFPDLPLVACFKWLLFPRLPPVACFPAFSVGKVQVGGA